MSMIYIYYNCEIPCGALQASIDFMLFDVSLVFYVSLVF